MLFSQLNEKMRAMDRSLLEKVAADIEMMDQDEGLSREEFDKVGFFLGGGSLCILKTLDIHLIYISIKFRIRYWILFILICP